MLILFKKKSWTQRKFQNNKEINTLEQEQEQNAEKTITTTKRKQPNFTCAKNTKHREWI